MGRDRLRRILSWLVPITTQRVPGRSGVLELTLENGRQVVNSPRANQSFGSLHRVWQRILAAALPADRTPQRILLLGLGAGSVPHILRKERGMASSITAVEIDPAMVALAREHFGLDDLQDVKVIVDDAFSPDLVLPGPFDLIVVDLFNDLDVPEQAATFPFVERLLGLLATDGLLLFNTIAHDAVSRERSQRIGDLLRQKNGRVRQWEPEHMNIVYGIGRHLTE